MIKTLPALSEQRIWLVDDDADDCFLFEQVMQQHFPQVAFACFSSGSALLTALREVADLPTLIFVDYWMPLQTGLELATQLRQHPSLSAIPVALLTGQSQLAEQSKGIWRVYQKPSSVDDLHRLIDQAIYALLSDK